MVKRTDKAGATASKEFSPNEQERDWIAFTLDGSEFGAMRPSGMRLAVMA